MNKGILKWLRAKINKIGSSIAFFPAIIAVGFLLLSWLMLELDFSDWGRHIKKTSGLLSLKDAGTARVIVSTIASGIISLTVFSFSMVMIVLNQAASQMSNRVLKSMIQNRFQQIVLGFYIGPIVYALLLLITIRDTDSGVYVPALSIYLLIVLTVVDIFLFIYFLDYVTNSVKYETIIHNIQHLTMKQMKKQYVTEQNDEIQVTGHMTTKVSVPETGYFQGFDEKQLIRITTKEKCTISILHTKGSYLVKGACILIILSEGPVPESTCKSIIMAIDIYKGQPIEKNPDYGFSQLAEVAIKALSPGINDPATAVLSLNALTDLFSYRLSNSPPAFFTDQLGNKKIFIKVRSFEELFHHCIYPIWKYGKTDQYIQGATLDLILQLKRIDSDQIHTAILDRLAEEAKQLMGII